MIVRQSDIEGIIKAASESIAAYLPTPLEKAEPPKEETSPEASASPEAAPEGDASASATPEASESASPVAAESASPEAPASPEGDPASPDEDPAAAAGEPEAPGALEAVYSGMSPEMLKAHYVALKKIIFAKHKMGLAEGAAMAEKPESADPAAIGADSTPPQSVGSPDMDKGGVPPPGSAAPEADPSEPEMTKNAKEDTNMEDLKKTEALTAEIADLKKSLEGVYKILEQAFIRPERKSVTSLEGLAKNEAPKTLDHKEAKVKLRAITSDPEKLERLTKAERELVLGYYEGRVDVSALDSILNK